MKLKTQNRSRVRAEIEGNSNQIKHTELWQNKYYRAFILKVGVINYSNNPFVMRLVVRYVAACIVINRNKSYSYIGDCEGRGIYNKWLLPQIPSSLPLLLPPRNVEEQILEWTNQVIGNLGFRFRFGNWKIKVKGSQHFLLFFDPVWVDYLDLESLASSSCCVLIISCSEHGLLIKVALPTQLARIISESGWDEEGEVESNLYNNASPR